MQPVDLATVYGVRAHTFASSVFPQPGGPANSTPGGEVSPSCAN